LTSTAPVVRLTVYTSDRTHAHRGVYYQLLPQQRVW
jgi:hypothetical protein